MKLKFEPLTKERFEEAVKITDMVFPDEKMLIRKWYRASLGFTDAEEYRKQCRVLEYWVVIDTDSNKIVALTGLYQDLGQTHEEIWLGWYCVIPEYRSRGVGRKTLEWTINEASSREYTQFRLWTTDHPSEVIAQKLYESLGIKIYREEMDLETGEKILYRQLQLR